MIGRIAPPIDHLDEVALEFTPQEVIALTEMDVTAAPNVRAME